MGNDMHQYHFIVKDQKYYNVAEKLNPISLQNIDNRHFTINPENISKPTYVNLVQSEADVNVFIRTLRAPKSGKNKNIEPKLEEILTGFGVQVKQKP